MKSYPLYINPLAPNELFSFVEGKDNNSYPIVFQNILKENFFILRIQKILIIIIQNSVDHLNIIISFLVSGIQA